MICSRLFTAVAIVVSLGHGVLREAAAQRQYIGSSPADSQYYGASGADPNGRVVNAEGRSVDRFGNYVDDYGWKTGNYRIPRHTASGSYYTGSSSSGGYGGVSYTSGIGYSVGLGAYSGGYSSSTSSVGPGAGATSISPPRTIIVGGTYPARTVMNNSTRGTVIEYTHNGNGYISTPGSTYQTVISSGPSIFPSVAVIQPSQPPVIIDSRPTQTVAKSFPGGSTNRQSNVRPATSNPEIKLVFPKESAAPLSYVLNGTVYSIKPGYSQTFPDDRNWTIEFFRGGSGSQPMRYELKAGIYYFTLDQNGWDLKYPLPPVVEPAAATPTAQSIPVPVPAPIPAPDL